MVCPWRFIFTLVFLVAFVGAFDVEGGSVPRQPPQALDSRPVLQGQLGAGAGVQQPQQSVVGSIGGQVAGAAAKVSGWYRAYQGFVAAAAKVNQLISFCCGVWLVMSTPLTLIGASITLKFTEAATVLFLGLYGLLLMGVEIPLGAVQTMLRQYFLFVYTRPGRAGFVIQIAIMAWHCHNVALASACRVSHLSRLSLLSRGVPLASSGPSGGLHHEGAHDLQRRTHILHP